MFRGGRVDSYGTGIASGLGYKKGGVIDGHKISSDGRVNFNIAGLVSPEMASEMANIKTGGERTGASFLKRAVNKLKGIPYAGRLIPKFSTMAAAGTASVPYLAAAAPVAAVGGLAYMNRPKTVEALQYMKEMNESGVFDETAGDDYTRYAETFKMLNETGTPLSESEVGLTSSKEDISSDIMDRDMAGFEEVTTEPGADRRPGESSLDALLRQGLERSKQRDLLENPPSQEEEQTIKSQLEKDKELFKELLGADKARGKDIGDMLASASASFLGTGDVREGFAEFMADQAKSGPSRTEKINQTAAGLAINDYIAGRRSKESLDQVLAKTKFGIDYASQMQQEAGSPKGKTWINALRIVGSSLKESTFSNKTIKDTLFQIFEKPTHIINDFQSKEYDDIDTEDLRVGFNIVPYKRGKIIIEKSSDGSVKPRTDLPIS
jgi:hypothetical protein